MLTKLPENISYYQIQRVVLDPIKLELCLELVNPIGRENIFLEFKKLVYFSISKTPDDEEGCYLIGDIKLTLVNDVPKILEKLQYGFLNVDINQDNFYYLHIEGDLCLEVVSCYYKMISSAE